MVTECNCLVAHLHVFFSCGFGKPIFVACEARALFTITLFSGGVQDSHIHPFIFFWFAVQSCSKSYEGVVDYFFY